MRDQETDEFFIGYAPPMPPRVARFVTRACLALGLALLVWAAALASGHVPLDGGTFEFGHPRAFRGTVVERPYPALRLDAADAAAGTVPLLVAPGKHGAAAIVTGLDGRHVTVTGTPIHRGAHTMIEIEPASLAISNDRGAQSVQTDALLEASALGPLTLTGEIVDSKCFLGVMVPGAGKTHSDCASLCIRGGIPPALHVEDTAGRSALLLLTGPAGEPIGEPALQAAGAALAVTGFVRHEAGWLVLRTDPRTWQRIGR